MVRSCNGGAARRFPLGPSKRKARMTRRWLLLLLILLGVGMPASAQAPSAELRAAAERLVDLVRGQAAPADLFTPAFLAEVPEAQVRAITAQLRAQYGAPDRVAGIEPRSPTMGVVHIETQRATMH